MHVIPRDELGVDVCVCLCTHHTAHVPSGVTRMSNVMTMTGLVRPAILLNARVVGGKSVALYSTSARKDEPALMPWNECTL